MPRLDYFLVAQQVSIDQTSNALSVFNIMEEIRSPGFPALIPSMMIVSAFSREEADLNTDFQCLVRISIPGEVRQEMPANFQMTTLRHRLIQHLQGVPLQAAGTIRIEVLLNGNVQHEYLIPVIEDTTAPPGQVIHLVAQAAVPAPIPS